MRKSSSNNLFSTGQKNCSFEKNKEKKKNRFDLMSEKCHNPHVKQDDGVQKTARVNSLITKLL